MIREIFQGFCMAIADSVPGVSGGSIAFLMGFYEPFINSLDSLSRRDHDRRKEGLLYLGKLGIGWVCGMGLAASILTCSGAAGYFRIDSSSCLWTLSSGFDGSKEPDTDGFFLSAGTGRVWHGNSDRNYFVRALDQICIAEISRADQLCHHRNDDGFPVRNRDGTCYFENADESHEYSEFSSVVFGDRSGSGPDFGAV